jgi:hypothetical protein
MLFDGALAPETLCDADVWDRAKIDRLHTNSTQTITKTGLELFFRIVVSSEWFKGQSQLLATTPGKRTGYRNSLAVSTAKSDNIQGQRKVRDYRGIFKRDEYPGESIFCVHDCHRKRNQDGE